MKKERIFYLDFIRGIAAVFIITFHFFRALISHRIRVSEMNLSCEFDNGNLA